MAWLDSEANGANAGESFTTFYGIEFNLFLWFFPSDCNQDIQCLGVMMTKKYLNISLNHNTAQHKE